MSRFSIKSSAQWPYQMKGKEGYKDLALRIGHQTFWVDHQTNERCTWQDCQNTPIFDSWLTFKVLVRFYWWKMINLYASQMVINLNYVLGDLKIGKAYVYYDDIETVSWTLETFCYYPHYITFGKIMGHMQQGFQIMQCMPQILKNDYHNDKNCNWTFLQIISLLEWH